MYKSGSILNFLIETKTLEDIVKNADKLSAMYHKAVKKIACFDEASGTTVKPTENNGYKFELFLHNCLTLLEPGTFGILEVNRSEEFAPVKNPEGSPVDSPNTARNMIYDLHKKWLGR